MTQFELNIGTKKEIKEASIEREEKEEIYRLSRKQSHTEKRAIYDHARNKKMRKIKKFSDIKSLWLRTKIWDCKKRGRKKNFECTLTPEELLKLIPRNLKCPIFKTKFVFDNSDPLYNLSIDRIINSKGYTKDNVVIVSFRANVIKNTATVEELYKLADFYSTIENNMVDK